MAQESHASNEDTCRQVAAFRKSVIPHLAELGVKELTVNYSGSGDEGSIDGIDVKPEGITIPVELMEQISDLVNEFLYSEHGNWEDEDGGTGTVVIDPVVHKIINKHGWYFTDVKYQTREF